MDQPPAASFTAFVSLHSQTPRAIETEIGAALCAIGEGKDFDFEFIDQVSNLSSFSLNCCFYMRFPFSFKKFEMDTLSYKLVICFSFYGLLKAC